MEICNIRDYELAQALEISLQRLYDICDIFDADPNDNWELKENEHFTWSNQSLGQRRFSSEGVWEICEYIEVHEKRTIMQRIRDWLSRRAHRIRHMLVVKRIVEITENSDSLVFASGRAYLRPRYARELLGLHRRQDVLNRAFEAEQKERDKEPLQIGLHFIERDNEICFGGSGIARIGNNLGTTLTKKHRREWCKLVAKETPKALQEVVEQKDKWEEKIKKAMEKAKRNAKGRCQLTGRKRGPADPFDLAVHHVYDKYSYPHLADNLENLIVIVAEIHQDFHQWMGGTKVSCNVDDLENYVLVFSTSIFSDDDGEKMSNAMRQIRRIRKHVKPLT